MQKLIIMQGPPGGGKTTKAKKIQHSNNGRAIICSTDDYFTMFGEYHFDPSMLATFHKANLWRAQRLLEAGFTVIVDNTNVRAWAARPYVEFAVERDIAVEFIRCDAAFANTHGVPPETVEKMRQDMEILSVDRCLNSFAPWEASELHKRRSIVAQERLVEEVACYNFVSDVLKANAEGFVYTLFIRGQKHASEAEVYLGYEVEFEPETSIVVKARMIEQESK